MARKCSRLEHLDALAAPQRQLLEEVRRRVELIPVIAQILAVDSVGVPSRWDVATDRGRAALVLRGQKTFGAWTPTTLLITSREGVQYRIPISRNWISHP